MIPHDDLLSQSSTFSTNQRIREVKYGDGFGQRTPDGLNDKRREAQISWIPLTLQERNDVHEFWNQVGVYQSFLWAAPNDVERRWRFSAGISEGNTGDLYVLSTSLTEEFA